MYTNMRVGLEEPVVLITDSWLLSLPKLVGDAERFSSGSTTVIHQHLCSASVLGSLIHAQI